MEQREITYSQAINEALREEMLRDKNIIVLGEDVAQLGGIFGVTKGLLKEFGEERIKDTPMSEEIIVGSGVGAAITGLRPVVEIMYMDFITLAMDPICNWAAKLRYMSGGQHKVPLVIRTQTAMGRGYGAQHAQSLEAWFVHTPGLKIAVPTNPYDAKGLLKTAIRDDNPVLFIEHSQLYFKKGFVPKEEYTLEFGKAKIKRKGTDITIVATSFMVNEALDAAQELNEKEGISVEIIDPLTLVPFDLNSVLNSVKKTGRLMIVHQACRKGGIGAEIASQVIEQGFNFLSAPIKIVAAKDSPIPAADNLENAILPHKNEIIKAAIELVKSN